MASGNGILSMSSSSSFTCQMSTYYSSSTWSMQPGIRTTWNMQSPRKHWVQHAWIQARVRHTLQRTSCEQATADKDAWVRVHWRVLAHDSTWMDKLWAHASLDVWPSNLRLLVVVRGMDMIPPNYQWSRRRRTAKISSQDTTNRNCSSSVRKSFVCEPLKTLPLKTLSWSRVQRSHTNWYSNCRVVDVPMVGPGHGIGITNFTHDIWYSVKCKHI